MSPERARYGEIADSTWIYLALSGLDAFRILTQGAALVIPHIFEMPHDELVIWHLSIQCGFLYDMECGDEVTALDSSGACLNTTHQIQG